MEFKSFDYDLKNEEQLFRDCGKDSLYKFLLYKDKAKSLSFDCDRCKYAKKVYNKLWGFNVTTSENFKLGYFRNYKMILGMDTINSFWITFTWTLNKFCYHDIVREFGITTVTKNSVNILLNKYDTLINIMNKNLSPDIVEKFVLFAQLTHTIGNFTLVPRKIEPYTKGRQTFNTARAIKWNDYFDLSLLWLFDNEESFWMNESIKAYIDTFVLNDYVAVDNKTPVYNFLI